MNNPENNKWIDKILGETIGSEKPKPDFEQWKEKHPKAVEILTSRASDIAVSKRPLNIREIIMKNPITKLAAAAMIIIAVSIIFNNGSINIINFSYIFYTKNQTFIWVFSLILYHIFHIFYMNSHFDKFSYNEDNKLRISFVFEFLFYIRAKILN